jgi:hypothetical protein
MTINLALLVVVGSMFIGAFLYIRKLSVDANLAKDLILKNEQLQKRHEDMVKIEEEKDEILSQLSNVKSGSTNYKRILSKLRSDWSV